MRHLETKRGLIRTWVTVTGAREQPGSGRRELDGPPDPVQGPVMKVHNGDKNKVKNNRGVVGGHHSGTINFGVTPQRDGDR
jgi:hypothetical protein